MYKFLTKNGLTLAFGIGVLISLLFIVTAAPNAAGIDSAPDEVKFTTGIFDVGLMGALVLVILTAIALIGFGLYHTLTNLKSSSKGLIGFLALIAVFVIAYATASTEVSPQIANAIQKFQEAGNGVITDNNLKFISGGITTSMVLVGLAALAFIVSEIMNFFK